MLLLGCADQPSSPETEDDTFSSISLKQCDPALVEAIQKSDARTLRELIAQKVNVNCSMPYSEKETPLLYVSGKNNPEMVELLVPAGADIHFKNEYGSTPLLRNVLLYNNEKIIQMLIKAGSDIHAKTSFGQNMLMLAIRSDDTNLSRILTILNTGCCNINATDNEGLNVLMHALDNNQNPDIIALLLKKGSDINTTDKNGDSALMHTVKSNRNIDILRTLPDRGADMQPFKDKVIPEAIEYNIPVTGPATPEYLKLLVDHGVNVTGRNDYHDTAFTRANIDTYGNSAPHIATEEDYVEVVKMLLKHGVDQKIINANVKHKIIN